ncbi:unnamed protein product, partial [Mesorhabditis spiculigera]
MSPRLECYSTREYIDIDWHCEPGCDVMVLTFGIVIAGDLLMGLSEIRKVCVKSCKIELPVNDGLRLLNNLFAAARPQAFTVKITEYPFEEEGYESKNWRQLVQWPVAALDLLKRPFAFGSFRFPDGLEEKIEWLQWSGLEAKTAVMLINTMMHEQYLHQVLQAMPSTRHFVFSFHFCIKGLASHVEYTIYWLEKACQNRPPDGVRRIIEVQFQVPPGTDPAEGQELLEKACALPPDVVNDTVNLSVRSVGERKIAYYPLIQNANSPLAPTSWSIDSPACAPQNDSVDWYEYLMYCY